MRGHSDTAHWAHHWFALLAISVSVFLYAILCMCLHVLCCSVPVYSQRTTLEYYFTHIFKCFIGIFNYIVCTLYKNV